MRQGGAGQDKYQESIIRQSRRIGKKGSNSSEKTVQRVCLTNTVCSHDGEITAAQQCVAESTCGDSTTWPLPHGIFIKPFSFCWFFEVLWYFFASLLLHTQQCYDTDDSWFFCHCLLMQKCAIAYACKAVGPIRFSVWIITDKTFKEREVSIWNSFSQNKYLFKLVPGERERQRGRSHSQSWFVTKTGNYCKFVISASYLYPKRKEQH